MKRYTALTLIFLALLILSFVGLRVYGFYHNERAEALHQAELAQNEAKTLEDLAQEEELRSACSLAWQEYNLEEKKAEFIRLQQGEIPYLKAQMKLISRKPLCDGYAMSLSAALRLSMDELEHKTKAIELREYARVQTSYAANRKLQTKRLFHKIWTSVTGQKD
jgi:hypothetical protein